MEASSSLTTLTASASDRTLVVGPSSVASGLRRAALDRQSAQQGPSRSQSTSALASVGGAVHSASSMTPSRSFPRFGPDLAGGEHQEGRIPRRASSRELDTRIEMVSDDGGKGSDASWTSTMGSVRFHPPPRSGSSTAGYLQHQRDRSSTLASTTSRATASSLFAREGHDRHPSSSTSLGPVHDSSLTRTASNTTASSVSSASFPATPAQAAAGSVVYRSAGSSTALPLLTSRKGKEREQDAWQAGAPMLSPPVRPLALPATTCPVRTRAPMPAIIDPRFSFPMRRGGANSSGSGSGSGRPSISRTQPVGLGLDETYESYVGNLGTRPLIDAAGRPLPDAYPSYAAASVVARSPDPLLSPESSPTSSRSSLLAPLPVSPTSPLTSTFPTPKTPAASSLPPVAGLALPPSRSARHRERVPRSTQRRKPSVLRAEPDAPSARNRSTSSAGSARSDRARSASLPNLRAVAEGDTRRPSIPYAFEPRPPRTRSPGAERRSKDSLRRGATPIIFPSRPVGSIRQHRHHPSAPPAVPAHKPPIPPRTKRNVVAAGAYEALMSRRPRVVVVDASPTSSLRGSSDALERDLSLLPTTVRRRVKGKRPAREGYLTEADVEELLDDDAEHSSVRRVLRETDRERAERAAWSDSAMRGIGFELSLRLAGREMEQGRKSLAIEQRRAEKKALRKEVTRRKRAEAAAATGGESEAELDDHGGRRRNRQFPAPDYSPPMPQSFDPFAQLGRKLSLSRSRERRRRAGEAGAVSDGVGLGIVDAFRRKRSASHSRQASATGAANTEATTPRTVRGQPIRHLRSSGSVDSLNSRMHSSAPVLPPLPSLQIDETFTSVEGNVTTHFGEALTAPVDLPLQPVGEMRRPSVTAQNAFLSLPPHLHHLLRSPADVRFSPSRPAPSVPLRLPAISASPVHSRSSTADSTMSAAQLSFALEEHLRKTSRSPIKSLEGLPVATVPPLVWRSREGSPAPSGSHSPRLVPSRSAPLLATLAPLKLGESTAAAAEESDPLLEHPFASRSRGRQVRRRSSQLSRQSRAASSASSVLDMNEEGPSNELFFHPPRRRPSLLHRPSPSIDIIESLREQPPRPPSSSSQDFRVRSVISSPVELYAQPPSHASHRALPPDFEEVAVAGLLPAISLRPTDALSRRPSATQTEYTTADEGASRVSASPVEERTALWVARPRPTPVQASWATTSFAREYLGTNTSLESGRPSPSGSFLRVADASESEPEGTLAAVRAFRSFIEISPVSSAPSSPVDAARVPSGLVGPASPAFTTSPRSSTRAFAPTVPARQAHLSIDSRHFISPHRVSPMASDVSHFSYLGDTVDDFPAPPALEAVTAYSASDGDDEAEHDEREDKHAEEEDDEGDRPLHGEGITLRERPTSIASLPVHSASPIPSLASLPVTGDEPVTQDRPSSMQSWLDLSDSDGAA